MKMKVESVDKKFELGGAGFFTDYLDNAEFADFRRSDA